MTMNESDAQKVLYRNFIKEKRHVLTVPNCKALYPRGESDLISVTQAGRVHEFEIKTSEADFNREFRDKERKHEILEEGRNPEGKCPPNYFWFVTPTTADVEIPEYAGHLTVCVSGCEVQKKAPTLHSGNITDRAREYLERGITVRHWKSK